MCVYKILCIYAHEYMCIYICMYPYINFARIIYELDNSNHIHIYLYIYTHTLALLGTHTHLHYWVHTHTCFTRYTHTLALLGTHTHAQVRKCSVCCSGRNNRGHNLNSSGHDCFINSEMTQCSDDSVYSILR